MRKLKQILKSRYGAKIGSNVNVGGETVGQDSQETLEERTYPNAIVLDIGSALCKVGIAGDDAPTAVFPSVVGSDEENVFVGNEAMSKRGKLKLRYPVYRGVVTDWNGMENIWAHTFYTVLKVSPEDHPILLTEALLNPKSNREKLTKMMFESFKAQGFYIVRPPILSLYASGRTTGLVLTSGEGVTSTLPMYEGYSLPHAVLRIAVAGCDLTDYLMRMLTERGYSFITQVERELVVNMKEELCYVAKNFAAELKSAGLNENERTFDLPEGKTINIGNERVRCPEVLFQPKLIGREDNGIHSITFSSIQNSDNEIWPDLYRNIVLAGGSTLFKGLEERLTKEIYKLAPTGTVVKVVGHVDRLTSAFIGGSRLASLSTFQKMWITREEYNETGPAIAHKKCF